MFLAINGNNTIELGAVGVVRVDLPQCNPNSIDVTHRHSPAHTEPSALPSLPKHPNCPLFVSPLPTVWVVYPECEILETKEVRGKSLRLDKVDVTCLTLTTLDLTLLAHYNSPVKAHPVRLGASYKGPKLLLGQHRGADFSRSANTDIQQYDGKLNAWGHITKICDRLTDKPSIPPFRYKAPNCPLGVTRCP
jgi:hypothetical protein